jgi:predicted AAA+ superfamily ATPase
MGVKNIIADDRLKLVKLLEEDKDYHDIVLARVRKIKEPSAISNYYLHYKKGFTWPNSIGESDFRHFFPFHKPAIEVLRAITYELTKTRSAIHFMHQTLKHR